MEDRKSEFNLRVLQQAHSQAIIVYGHDPDLWWFLNDRLMQESQSLVSGRSSPDSLLAREVVTRKVRFRLLILPGQL